MPQINLVWSDANNQPQSYQFSLSEADIDKTLKVGRDNQQCDLLLAHNTVSRVHAEISFKSEWQRFYLRNLAIKNPVRVDGGLLTDGESAIYQGSMIQLGQILLNVSEIMMTAATHSHTHLPQTPQPASSPSVSHPAPEIQGNTQSQQNQEQANSSTPKLVCPKCQTLQLLSLRNSNCPVCGHFLADASSRYFF